MQFYINKQELSWLREDGGSLLLTDHTKIPVSKLNREKVKQGLAKKFKL